MEGPVFVLLIQGVGTVSGNKHKSVAPKGQGLQDFKGFFLYLEEHFKNRLKAKLCWEDLAKSNPYRILQKLFGLVLSNFVPHLLI